MRFVHVPSIGVAVSALVASTLLASPTSASMLRRLPLSADVSCSGHAYAGYETTNYGNDGVDGDINYESDDMILANDNTDAGAIWLGSNSQPDSSAPYGADWLQAGYFVGTADGTTIDTTAVYVESEDLNGGTQYKDLPE